MKKFYRVCSFLAAALTFSAAPLGAWPRNQHAWHLIPNSSVERTEDIGVRSHTNHLLLLTADTPGDTPSGLAPAVIRQVYNLPQTGGGAGTIAVIDAYDYPTALNDFNVFSQQFGLPIETSPNPTARGNKALEVLYAAGHRPQADGGWSEEAALDIEWAHAMAPGAKILLVEARSSSNADLLAAVEVAGRIRGVKEISMSWGGSEWRGETRFDAYFLQPGVVYFAASGDTGGRVIYPGCSPDVVSCGGTTLNFDDTGGFVNEEGWSGSGGGPSRFEVRPGYQNVLQTIVGNSRGVPDFSFDSDPDSGVSVYDSFSFDGMAGWMIFGGTSVSAPALAGIVNSAAIARGTFAHTSRGELRLIYSNLGSAFFQDITAGSAGPYSCEPGWDFVTGVGSVFSLTGK
jgi:kumamolisin